MLGRVHHTRPVPRDHPPRNDQVGRERQAQNSRRCGEDQQGTATHAIVYAELTIHIGGQSPRTIALDSDLTIGRVQGNGLVLDDPRVSRNHAMIRLLGEETYYLIDLGSSNGTFLNGRPVTVMAYSLGSLGSTFYSLQVIFGVTIARATESNSRRDVDQRRRGSDRGRAGH
ncbi:MAG: FHA domain-containing protein [Verrucomicrobiae bacterium]|nr:FHA domain-containing protein [Verrucomicrobiae bacterium]